MLHGYTPADRFLPYLSWTDIDALPDKANDPHSLLNPGKMRSLPG